MMLPTHVLVGMALATPVAVAVPELAGSVVAGAVVGSVLPDVDVVARHRRTLHFPSGYVLLAVPTVIVVLVWPSTATAAVATATVAAAVHSRMDAYGGSYELRPWERTTDRAVYDHVRGEWRLAKRSIRYDGSRSDLLLSFAAATPPLVLLDGTYRPLVGGALAVAVSYTLLRRRLPDVVDDAADRLRG
ncbi:metal-dependent hydrolase [Halorubrum tibetense]|uniref:Metal-dependent hydrolase n=1 Tax=Halorubrum tibetense TaxID=175631 RepID=A0ABD5SCF6_9EURY